LVDGGMKFLLIILILSGCNEVIIHDLSEEQANRIWVALRQHNFSPAKQRAGTNWDIAVARGEAVSALDILERLRLPRRKRPLSSEGGSSLLPSRGEREANRERELSGRLEETLLTLPGVADARVHLVIAERGSTASVLVVTLPGIEVDPKRIREIVAGGGSIQREHVTVAISALPAI